MILYQFIAIILVLIAVVDEISYIILFFKIKSTDSKFWTIISSIYLMIWVISLITIPIISSSFITGLSYFFSYWIWFLFLGLILNIIGIRLLILAIKKNKIKGLSKGWHEFQDCGVYAIMRHPIYSAWGLIFVGLTLVFDSIIGLIFCPFLILLLSFKGYLEERYILIPKIKKRYKIYMEKISSRLYPMPYNFLLLLITFFIAYIGLINFIFVE